MKNLKHNNTIGQLTWLSTVFLIPIMLIFLSFEGCNTPKKTKPCGQCPQYTETIDSLELRIHSDSVTMDLMEYEYLVLWEENQRFSSMLAEIEGEPGGHEILEKLWNKN